MKPSFPGRRSFRFEGRGEPGWLESRKLAREPAEVGVLSRKGIKPGQVKTHPKHPDYYRSDVWSGCFGRALYPYFNASLSERPFLRKGDFDGGLPHDQDAAVRSLIEQVRSIVRAPPQGPGRQVKAKRGNRIEGESERRHLPIHIIRFWAKSRWFSDRLHARSRDVRHG